jgi:hypothetical protein
MRDVTQKAMDVAGNAIDEIIRLLAENAELKRKLEDAQASAYAESVDAGMENRRLKRALWIAHAYKAKFKRWWLHLALDYEASMIRPDTKTIKRIKGKIGNCEKSERKCRAMAEKFK